MKKILFILSVFASSVAVGQMPNIWFPVSGTDTYTANVSTFGTGNTNKQAFLKFTNTNTGASTININGQGAVALRMWDGDSWEPLTAGQISTAIVYRISHTGSYYTMYGTGSSGGSGTVSGTTNQIAYFSAPTTVNSLTTATYPSLTELSYLKGVTSAVQTQLNAKQATLVSGTNIKTVNGNTLLGSGDVQVGTLRGNTSNALTNNTSFNVNDGTAYSYLNFGVGVAPIVELGASSDGGTSYSQIDVDGYGDFRVYATNSFSFGSPSNTYLSINSSGAFGFGSIPNYGTSGQVFTTNGGGSAATWTTLPTFSNGLTLSSGDVKLGGTISQTTTFSAGTNTVSFTNNTSDFIAIGNNFVQVGTNSARFYKTGNSLSMGLAGSTVTTESGTITLASTNGSKFISGTFQSGFTDLIDIEHTGTGDAYPIGIGRNTTASIGDGTGLRFYANTGSGNYESTAFIESEPTDLTATSEDSDLVFKVQADGATATEKFRIVSKPAALTDGAAITITTTKHTLTTDEATITYTDSYAGDQVLMEVTFNTTSSTWTFPTGALCIFNGTPSGDNTMSPFGASGDKILVYREKIGSNYYYTGVNMGQ